MAAAPGEPLTRTRRRRPSRQTDCRGFAQSACPLLRLWGAPPPGPPPQKHQTPGEWSGGELGGKSPEGCNPGLPPSVFWVVPAGPPPKDHITTEVRIFWGSLQGPPKDLRKPGAQIFWGVPAGPPQRISPEGTPFGFTPVPQKVEPCKQAATESKAQFRKAANNQ